MENEQLLTEEEAAKILNVGASTLRKLRAEKRIGFIRIGARKGVRYRLTDLHEFIQANVTQPE